MSKATDLKINGDSNLPAEKNKVEKKGTETGGKQVSPGVQFSVTMTTPYGEKQASI